MFLNNLKNLGIKNIIGNLSLQCRAPCTTKAPEYESLEVDDSHMPPIPQYKIKENETLSLRKARLLYQSRKRGMLENGLVLSTFAARYLKKMNVEQTEQYDRLINLPSNDWDIYYWATGYKPVPVEYDNEIMRMLKDHVNNRDKETRYHQPDLYADSS